MKTGASRGGISLEMAVVLPVLLALIFGGAAVAYSALAKASLQMTAMRAARELAADEATRKMETDQVYLYREFTETYGLPRAKVRMLTGHTNGILVVGACYRVPIPLPQGLAQEPKETPLTVQVLRSALEAEGIDQQTTTEVVQGLEELGRAVGDVVQEGQTLWSRGAAFWEHIKQLNINQPLVREEFLPVQGAKMDQFDSYVADLCSGMGITVSAKSAFWSERSVKLPDPKPALEVVKLEPNPVQLKGASPPGVRATIVVRAEDPTTCGIQVSYKSGPSKAAGLQERAATQESSEGHLAQWQWNVGTQTSPGLWPVTVRCDNGQSVTTYLQVLNESDSYTTTAPSAGEGG